MNSAHAGLRADGCTVGKKRTCLLLKNTAGRDEVFVEAGLLKAFSLSDKDELAQVDDRKVERTRALAVKLSLPHVEI